MEGDETGRMATDQMGFTVLELIMAMSTAVFMLALTVGAYRQFNEAIVVQKAAGLVATDLALTRSYAIQRRSNVSLVAQEPSLRYQLRDVDGTVLAYRDYDRSSGLPLDFLDVQSEGDSVTFNSRGLLVGGGGAEVAIARGSRNRKVYVNALGRYSVQQ